MKLKNVDVEADFVYAIKEWLMSVTYFTSCILLNIS